MDKLFYVRYSTLMLKRKILSILTATPARSQYNEQEVYSRLFDGIVTFGLTESRNEKYIRYMSIFGSSHPNRIQE